MKNVLGAAQAGVPAVKSASLLPGVSGEEQGENPRPTRGPLQDRSASPPEYRTSGLEQAMSDHADKMHPVRRAPRG